ncbi:DoxD-like protein family protein [Ketogulonicigenium robustum]|uniref:DoxD-like protein family protein n=1 Tax=Ketogulonicigenium robustum TaxID=92947 RepID=A0A1W6P090_9RHOB|nr:DoxX family protein [Ketogulonicigenium robustum]ARO14918.1 DoxD-like protein family protein [Ketogulonicigenium robustum]
MIDLSTAPYAILILRLALAVLFFAHAGLKLFVFKPAGTVGYFQSLGLPGWFAYLTIAAEILGALALTFGIVPRLAALALIPLMLGTIIKVHGPAGFWFTNPNGGWEYPAFWTIALLVLVLLGDGAGTLVASPF